MKEPNRQRLVAAGGIALLAVFAGILWLAVSKFLAFLSAANPSIAAAIVGGMATILAAVGVALYTQSQTSRREIEEAHRARKVEIYKEFLDLVARMMAAQNTNVSLKPPSEQELIDFLVKFKTQIILWGSPRVIKAQLEFEKTSNRGGNVLFAVDDLYKAIRDDIGLSNFGLNNRELVKMYLKDPTELDRMSATNQTLTVAKQANVREAKSN